MKIKLMSFNIQHGRNHNLPGDVIDLSLMAKTILDVSPDFVGLQEVRCGLGGDFLNQPEIISSITGGRPYFGQATTMGADDKGYGNAVISHLPVVDCKVIPIEDPEIKKYDGYYETRCVMKLTVKCGYKPLTILVSHFGLNPDEQENAVDTVLKTVSECQTPLILMGDLNMQAGEPPLLRLATSLSDAAVTLHNEEDTFPSHQPDRRIDYFWYRGIKPLSIYTHKVIASDHYPLIAEFEI